MAELLWSFCFGTFEIVFYVYKVVRANLDSFEKLFRKWNCACLVYIINCLAWPGLSSICAIGIAPRPSHFKLKQKERKRRVMKETEFFFFFSSLRENWIGPGWLAGWLAGKQAGGLLPPPPVSLSGIYITLFLIHSFKWATVGRRDFSSATKMSLFLLFHQRRILCMMHPLMMKMKWNACIFEDRALFGCPVT